MRVLIALAAVVAVVAVAAVWHLRANAQSESAAETVSGTEIRRLDAPHDLQILTPPRPEPGFLKQMLAGERHREQEVVNTAARATLERARREAAAAVAGEWQDWMVGSGGNGSVIPGVGGYVLPTTGTFTSGFGPRWGTMHAGIDIANAIGTPVYAVSNGTVIDAGPASGFGLWVRIKHDDGSITVYGHLYDFFVSVGERVPAGMQIARMGNRGDSTGPHLHFEVILDGNHVDPQQWLALHGLRVG